MKGVFCFRVKGKDGKEGIWVVDAKNGNGSVSYGGPGRSLFLTVSGMRIFSFLTNFIFFIFQDA